MEVQSEIELKKVYKLLKNSIEDLVRLYKIRYYIQSDTDLLNDLTKFKFSHPEYSKIPDLIYSEIEPSQPDLESTLDERDKNLRYISEPELLFMLQEETKDRTILDIMEMPTWNRLTLDNFYRLNSCPEE